MNNSKEFINYLTKKFKTNSDEELVTVLQGLGEEKVRLEYESFQGDEVETMKQGGKLSYLKCLQEFKKGGKMKNCGCGGQVMKEGKKIPKAFLGAILGAVKGLSTAGKAAGMMGKIAKGMDTFGKIAGTVGKVAGALGANRGTNTIPMMPTQTVSMVNPSQVPNNPVTTQTNPALQQRSIPQVKMQKGGEIKKDPKLEKLKALKASSKKKSAKK